MKEAKMATIAKKQFHKNEIKEKLATDNRWLERGIVAIFKYQTDVEQQSEMTTDKNGVGFNGLDAEFLSSLAKQVMQGKTLSERQIEYGRKKMLKYAGQLTRIANGEI